ncbi:cupredoxin domain-containing protein [Patulibacter americanus]|uniref:cupredoxin domain-containing protein n=1 Tax=Patulibacter americanus TaxID=588672 RepID=UPI00042111CD|nr:plastocyanin/azurin family copper-binding protein [Patulibacter americanus]
MSAPQPDPTTRRSFLGLAAVGVLGLTLVGCGSDDGGAATTAPATSAVEPEETTTETETQPTTTAADADAVAVAMKDIQFVPKVVTVKVGQTVVWTNAESIQHDVRALEGAKFQSALFGEGGTYEYTPKTAGTVEYDCSVHPGMVGTLEVVA